MNRVKEIEVFYANRLVGRIALNREGLCLFEYSAEWLASGFSISPFELPLQRGYFEAKVRPFDGGFGVFDDSLPDGWGMLILERYLRQRGIEPNTLSLLDLLAIIGSNGRGALEYRPERGEPQLESDADLERLAEEAQEILSSSDYNGEGIAEFQLRGGSPGGARPKIFTRYEGREWMVKFPAKGDPESIGVDEYRYSLLAKRCGIEMAETHLFEGRYFGVERFDRTPEGKLHVASVASLLGADYRLPSIDYMHIFQLSGALTHSIAELWKIYRLMVFNYLIGNKDDHAKNFAFIYRNGEWSFAPAFDLLPSDGINGYHTTSINGNIEPSEEDLIAVAERFSLPKRRAFETLEEIRAILT